MSDANDFAGRYLAAWNETDADRRRDLLESGFTPDVKYVDPHMSGTGHLEIDALIAGVHARFPGFRFGLVGKADGFGDRVRFSWSLGPETDPGMIQGTDFAIVEGGRFKTVTGFLDKVPATPAG